MKFVIGFFVDSVPITREVIAGTCSLGGSESACVGLARALAGRGHDVHILATKLDPACRGKDAGGVIWEPAEEIDEISRFMDWDVFCALRMFTVFGHSHIPARLRLLWNQDLLTSPPALMSLMWSIDRLVYVSDYQRRQYEDLLAPLQGRAFVTKNGFDPGLVPTHVTKDPHRIIHISRPERALRPLLAMWPAFRQAHPQATLQVCRYSSMYDATGWGQVCDAYDRELAHVQAEVGGIEWLGELAKPALYRAIAESAVMWYPGVADFAETSCIAAIEAQACGTPFVGSFKGALPETVPSGILIPGDADTEVYQAQSMAAVGGLLEGCARSSVVYRQMQTAGRAHVAGYTFEALAAGWETWIEASFTARYAGNPLGVMRQLLHEDDHVAARTVAASLPEVPEAQATLALCDRVFAGLEQGPEQYAAYAVHDVEREIGLERENGRMGFCLPFFTGCTHVLDVACGNGTFALLLAQTDPAVRITAVDYSQDNIDLARGFAEKFGLADRVTFVCASAWDFPTQTPRPLPTTPGGYDGLFCGEFLEHVAACDRLVDYLETYVAENAPIVYTVPHGPFIELLARDTPHLRSHVHHFRRSDLGQLFGAKRDITYGFLQAGDTMRGNNLAHWAISYHQAPNRSARPRDLDRRVLVTRPMQRLSAGLIVKNGELDLGRCLDSIWRLADEIVVGDTGSTDGTATVAAAYKARVIPVAPIEEQPEGFAGARNAVLAACTGEWFLWIDADEVLAGGSGLRRYIDSDPVFQGFALWQNHLMLDAPMHHDTPVRLFRRVPEIRFFGCIHEQPGWQDANTDIYPALEIADVQIAHLGYLHEGIRREKMLTRNLPLLKRERQMFPERRLGGVLVLRDLVNLADYDREEVGGAMTQKAIAYYQAAAAIFDKHFADPSDKYHALARPWYEKALQALGGAVEIEIAIGGKRGGLNGQRAKAERLWVKDAADLTRMIDRKVETIRQQMNPPRIHTDPFEEVSP
jgi:glycosyltransferase involved in cell wall biosynthesis/2-polyprenyl-3-methyl-5-hydroxy-6-metoxy-1,4-benzoquinol methylase